MKRGDIYWCAGYRDYGKVRPFVIVQSDLFTDNPPSLTACPFTTDLHPAPLFRLTVEPAPGNGLEEVSQIMVDKVTTLAADRVRERAGKLTAAQISELDKALRRWLDL